MSARVLVAIALAIGTALGAGSLVAGGGRADKPLRLARAADSAATAPFVSGLDFAEPPAVRSSHGRLKATVIAQNVDVPVSGDDNKIAGTQVYSVKWKGGITKPAFLGPTFHAHPGDVVELTLDNRLTVPADSTEGVHCTQGTGHHGSAHAAAGAAELTNLHFHGFHVTPREHTPFGDTVLVHLGKGKWRYHFRIPKNHDRGTFWYHAHVHECTNDQVTRGLAGLFFIGDSRKDMPKRFRHVQTRALALKDIQTVPNPSNEAGAPPFKIDPQLDLHAPTQRTVNGLVNPTMKIRPGETQMWTILNASNGIFYQLVLADKATANVPGVRGVFRDFIVVAQDGNSLRRAVKRKTLLIGPGARYDILVRGPRSGAWVLKTLPFDQGFANGDAAALATLEVAGPAAKSLGFPEKLSPPHQVFPKKRGPTRTFVFDLDLRSTQFYLHRPDDPPNHDPPFPPPAFSATINNAVFDPKSPGVTPVLGTTERWLVYNKSAEWHPFHIHQNDFRVVKTDTDAGAPADLPGDHDVVLIPPGTPPKPSLTILDMPFTDYPGNFVFHCHILDHEDNGMMSLIQLRTPFSLR